MRDTLDFGTGSEEVRRKCIARGNDLPFAKAKEIARSGAVAEHGEGRVFGRSVRSLIDM